MGILKNQPRQITREMELESLKNLILNISKQTYQKMVETQTKGIDLVWNHPTFSPQEIIDYIGTPDILYIFQYHGGLTTLINQISQLENEPSPAKLPSKNFVVENGTITVLDEDYTPSSS